ncbi:MAG: hypothetical protein KKB25_03210 [Nanoarchaeota archaeon]|nr:hypothetical protein [Nanoarchaeota archaeon]
MEQIIFEELTAEQKKMLIEGLCLKIDQDGFVRDKDGNLKICPFTNRKVHFEDASIMPGSTIVMNTSSLSLSEYITQYIDV